MLIFELSGITGIWVTNLDEDKTILHFDHRGIPLLMEGGNDGTQVLKGRNVAQKLLRTTVMSLTLVW